MIRNKAEQISDQELCIIYEIKKVNTELEEAYKNFQYQTDEDLLESSIYHIKALKAKHNYLIKMARENNISAQYMKFNSKDCVLNA